MTSEKKTQHIRKKRKLSFFNIFRIVAHSHYHFAVSNKGHRDLGIILSTAGWLLIAFYFNLVGHLPSLPTSSFFDLNPMFVRFTLLHIFMTIFFFFLCLAKGVGRNLKIKTLFKRSFKCKKFGVVFIRTLIAILSAYSLSLAMIWNPDVDNSMLYITDAFWILIILKISGVKINLLSVFGILLASGVIFVMYFYNVNTGTPVGFFWGILSGITLGIITVITSYLIEFVPARIIVFYHGVIGILLSFILASIFGGLQGFAQITLSELVGIGIAGITFSIGLYAIVRAFSYLESYIIGVMTFFFHVFIEGLHFVFTSEVPSIITIIGTSILIISAIVILLATEILTTKRKELYSLSKKTK